MKTLRRAILCLVVGGLFGWAMSTKFPTPHAVLSGIAAGAFMQGSLAYFDRADRRELARRSEDAEETEEA